jgi:hypothetical protein
MQARVVLAVLTIAILALPITAAAQEATLIGQVVDTTGAVLPGVVVRAIHEATGTTTEVVTDGRGGFRIPARIGAHQITAELAGFTTVTRTGVSLSVGQEVVVNLQLSPSAVQETVTVTGEAPLVNPTNTRVSGVVNTRQIEELPLNGRSLLDLTLLARGQTANHTGTTPTDTGNKADYHINIDGQQVTTQLFNRLNPTYSRDAIAEFEFVSNRFDATQGRTHGAQLNAITKSGTNTVAGTFAGYFRHSRFNAADFIQQRVLPYSNQQLSGTIGGPIRRNRAHIFGSYEYEREPQILTYDSPYPFFNIDSENFARTTRKVLGRGDLEITSQMHMSVRHARADVPKYLQGGGALLHPSATNTMELHTNSTIGSLTQIFGNRAANELKIGYTSAWDLSDNTLSDPFTERLLPSNITRSRIMCLRFLGGYQIGGCSPAPTGFSESIWSVRDQFTFTYQLGPGSHTLKTGGELLSVWVSQPACGLCAGVMDLSGGPVPANIGELFPVWNDISTWKRDAPELARIARQFEWVTGSLGPSHRRPDLAGWLQDDWTISPRLTLNLGVRYDVSINKYANDVEVLPFLPAGRKDDMNNVAPRLGFAYSMNDRTVVRGGWGLYFLALGNTIPTQNIQASNVAEVVVVNDGRSDFVVNPFNGPAPTVDQVRALGRERSIIDPISSVNPDEPYSYQTSIGVERQIAESMAVSIDLMINETRNDGGFGGRPGDRAFFVENVNLSYNPATGANYPFTDVSRRPYPGWGPVGIVRFGAESSRRTLEFGFQKRFSNRWQASGQYQLSRFRDFEPQPEGVGFQLAPDFGGEWTLGVGDQRHRAVFNGIVDVGYGFQVSGLYFYGSGKRRATTYGGDLRRMGSFSTNRLRPDGTIVPRNNFVGDPLHRVDVRLQRRFNFAGVSIDGIAEVFNLFNHENYGNYITAESNRNYGRPTATAGTSASLQNVAYQSRSAQFGFRVAF